MQNKKPLANIVEIKKKNIQIYIPENQASNPDFNPELKGEVTIMVTARIESISDDLNDDLFNFKRIIKVIPTDCFVSKVRSAEDVAKEVEEKEKETVGSDSLFDVEEDNKINLEKKAKELAKSFRKLNRSTSGNDDFQSNKTSRRRIRHQ